jgi:hypothetical protein
VPVRRLLVSLYVWAFTLAFPVVVWAQGAEGEHLDAPEGDDHTLTTIFLVALSIPLLQAVLTLIDVARGRHTSRHDDH